MDKYQMARFGETKRSHQVFVNSAQDTACTLLCKYGKMSEISAIMLLLIVSHRVRAKGGEKKEGLPNNG